VSIFFRLLRRFSGSYPLSRNWTPCAVLLRKQLADGTRAGGTLMRRRVASRTEYRRMTDEEYRGWIAEQES